RPARRRRDRRRTHRLDPPYRVGQPIAAGKRRRPTGSPPGAGRGRCGRERQAASGLTNFSTASVILALIGVIASLATFTVSSEILVLSFSHTSSDWRASLP